VTLLYREGGEPEAGLCADPWHTVTHNGLVEGNARDGKGGQERIGKNRNKNGRGQMSNEKRKEALRQVDSEGF
jgi:hypothetical protein